MPEYMDYNTTDDSDGPRSKAKKIRSALLLLFCAVWLVFIALWAFLRAPANTRSNFTPVTCRQIAFSNTLPETASEFMMLAEALENSEFSMPMEAGFNQKYPKTAKIFMDSAVSYSSSDPEFFEEEDCLCLIMPYVVTAPNDEENADSKTVKGMDLLILPYACSESRENGRVFSTVLLEKPIRLSLRYEYGQGVSSVVRSEPLDTSRFRLNFYDLSLNIQSGPLEEASYTLSLSSPLTQDEVKSNRFVSEIRLTHNERERGNRVSGGVGDSELARLFTREMLWKNNRPGTSYRLRISFNDLMYERFNGLSLNTESEAGDDAPSFSISVN